MLSKITGHNIEYHLLICDGYDTKSCSNCNHTGFAGTRAECLEYALNSEWVWVDGKCYCNACVQQFQDVYKEAGEFLRKIGIIN